MAATRTETPPRSKLSSRMHPWRRTGIVCIAMGSIGVGCCAASEPIAHLLACRDISDAASRLACFDRESAALVGATRAAPASSGSASAAAVPRGTSSPMNAERAPPSRAGARASPPAAAPLDAQRTFGLPEAGIVAREVAAGARAPDLSHISAHLIRIATAADGRLLFSLDNAQVWQTLAPGEELLARAGDAVRISRGFLGSYYLRLPSGRGCKVTRLR